LTKFYSTILPPITRRHARHLARSSYSSQRGDEDESEVVVEGPLERVAALREGGVGGAVLEEAGADEHVDGGTLEHGGSG
jgi:hypothetical protein